MRVSDFKLVDPGRERTKLIAAIEDLNRTWSAYERERPFHEILERRMRMAGSNVAASSDESALTHEQLLNLSGRIASWIETLQAAAPRIAGVLMENTPEMLAAVLGILRAGAAYLPINPDLPLDRIQGMLADTSAQVLFTERKFAREANRLQWECSGLTHLMCLDSPSFVDEDEAASELSRLDLWEYVGETATDAISGGGWKNSYTGEDLSAEVMAEYAENTYRKLRPLLTPQSRVLEIGCSTGLTMFRLAPACGFYCGIDFSKTILATTQAEVERRGIRNIRLECLAAHEVDNIGEGDFDLVVINSVVQNFNGHNYLRRVLRKAARLLKPEGRIFLGDLMDQERKQNLVESLTEFQRANAGKGYTTKTDWSAELFVSRAWIEDMCQDFEGSATASHSEKICTIPNELTEFRFDSLVTIRRGVHSANERGKRHRYQASRPQLDSHKPEPPALTVAAEQPAYIIYTSGTTGKPKGVVVSHRAIHNYVQWAARHYFSEGAGDMALFTSPAFDLTLTSIFVPLYLGRAIRCFRNRDVDRLLEAVFTAAGDALVNAVKLTPSHINILETCSIQPAAIQVAIVGGEDLTPRHVEILRRCAPGVRIYNEYGPTEATIGCTVCLVEDPPIHIGKPVDNTEIWILGSDLEVKPIGAPGELCVAGDCLASGYWGDPELTDRKFVPHPVDSGQRIYRTGDLARWTQDGNLTLLGRADHQVKIRGNRIELGEIESQLRSLPGVRDAVVLAREDTSGDKALCAYLIPALESGPAGPDVQALRTGLARLLPEFLIPSYFAMLPEFPLSPNGKLDRKRLPEPEAMAQARGAGYEPPATETEKALAAIWGEVLGIGRISVNDDFFSLGGHSLKATQVVSRVHRTLEARLELRDVFRRPRLRSMAAAIDEARRFRFAAIDPLPPAEDYELSHAQRRLWILQQIEADSIAYNIHDALEIEGPLDAGALAGAFETIVGRHESLRTVIVVTSRGPRQKVPGESGFRMEFSDCSQFENPVEEAERTARADACAPFELSRGPLLRVRLLRLSDQRHRLLMTMHHVIADGWSAGVMTRELMEIYRARCAGKPPRLLPLHIQYKDYAAWQNRLLEDAGEHERYWHERLAGPLPRVDLPADFPRPVVQSFEGSSLPCLLPGGLVNALRQIEQRERVSLFMLLNAAVKATIFRLTGATDLIVGVPVAGRTHVDLEGQIGFFVNTLALRDEIRPLEGFRDLLSRIRRTTTEAFEHQVYPFDKLVSELNPERDTSRAPLFDVMLVLHNNEQPAVEMEGLRITSVGGGVPVSRFDLTFHFFETNNGIEATIEYATALFREARVRRLWECFVRLIESAAKDLSKPVAELDVLSEAEREMVTVTFNATAAPWESPLVMFRQQLATRPDSVAVKCGNRQFTYRELDLQTSALAARILADAKGNDIVAARLDRSERNLITLLACLKAGCAYLPIDPSYPAERVSAILASSGAGITLTDAEWTEWPAGGFHAADLPGEGEIAYIVYTSGSTGIPKGVAGTTKCLGNLISWQRRILGDGLRSVQYAALGFDVSVQEMLFPVCSGGTLCVASDDERQDPAKLREFLDRNEIELATMPFSGLNLLFGTQQGLERLGSLRHLITSGEQLRLTPELRQFLEHRPDVQLHNQYGPSETHVVTSHMLSAAARNLTELPPIGRPIANTRCYILDASGQPAPIGVAGELFVGGANVARGYLNDPDLTARRFRPEIHAAQERMYQTGDICRWRDDGEIEFLGRRDDQVKIRGYRVETGEVEALLLEYPDVKAACVTTWKTPSGQTELAAYYSSANALDETILRGLLGRRLPPYMIPARFVHLDKLPLTSSGKVNRRALPSPANLTTSAPPEPEIPVSAVVDRTARVFARVLERERVGLFDDFFQMGGNSLRAVQLAAVLQEEFSIGVPPILVFQRPTVQRIAKWVEDLQTYRERHEDRFVAPLNDSLGPAVFALPPLLGYAMAFRRLAELIPSHRIYGLDFLEGPNLIDRYGEAIASIHPNGTAILLGYSGGGNVAFELAKHLESQGRSVTLILLDSFRLDSTSQRTEEQVQRAIRLNLEYFDRHLENEPEMASFVTNDTVRAILVGKMGSYLRYLDTIENRGRIYGDIHLIESTEFEGDPRRAAWANATSGRFIRHQGHGAHIEMILEKSLAANAAVVSGILAEMV